VQPGGQVNQDALAGHFIAMRFLIAGKLTHLPGNPLVRAKVKTIP